MRRRRKRRNGMDWKRGGGIDNGRWKRSRKIDEEEYRRTDQKKRRV